MSAWIVSKTHIDALVHAGIDAELIRPEEATEFGRMLWRENLHSVADRYPNDRDGERPGPVSFRDNDVETYEYEPMDGGPGITLTAPHVVNAAAGCYDYQSCEHPGYAGSRAKQFADTLYELTKSAPGRGPWGIDRRDAYLIAEED